MVRLLVKRITVHSESLDKGKRAKVLIEYRFPAVVNDSTGIREDRNYSVSRTVEFAAGRSSTEQKR